MTDHSHPHRHLEPVYALRAPALVLLSQTEMVERIEAARLIEAGPQCRTCGSTSPIRPTEKWCPRCQQVKASACFPKNRSNHDGVGTWCRECERARVKLYRTRKALRTVGVAS